MNIEQVGGNQFTETTAWQRTVSDVNDPKNLGAGEITWWVVVGGVGARDTFTSDGAKGIRMHKIGSEAQNTPNK